MRKKYSNNYLCPSICKVLWERYSKNFNWTVFSKSEMEESYLKFKTSVKNER